MSISIKSRKAKGRNFQQYIAKKISQLLNIPEEKDGDIESRPMGQAGTDIILRGKALKLFPFAVENKNQESWSIHGWIKQAKTNQTKNTDWLLFCKRNHDEPVVVLDVDVFFKIYSTLLSLKDDNDYLRDENSSKLEKNNDSL